MIVALCLAQMGFGGMYHVSKGELLRKENLIQHDDESIAKDAGYTLASLVHFITQQIVLLKVLNHQSYI